LLRRGRYDIFHNHAGVTWEGCWGGFAAADAYVPIVWTDHLPYLIDNSEDRALRLRASRLTAYTIGVSRGVARSLIEHNVVLDQRTRVVWNGIDLAPFALARQPELRATLLGLDAATRLVLCVGRLTPQKGHAALLEAVTLARRCEPRLVVALVGNGPLRDALAAQAARLGIADAVLFLGHCGHVADLLRCADVLVQPSEFEGLPLAVIEGMAAALPAVVTDVVGCNETVVHEESGIVVPPNSPTALADALLRIVQQPELAGRLGAAARRRAELEFAAPVMARRTLAVYAEALCGQAPRAATPMLTVQAAGEAA